MGRFARSLGVTAVVLSMAGLWAPTAARANELPSISVADVSAVEGDGGVATIPVPVDLSAPSAVTVKVPYAVIASSDGTADAADATFKLGTLVFLAGVTSKTIGVASIGDTDIEPDQHLLVVLGTPVNGTATVADGSGTVTLVDDDANGVNPGIEASIGKVVVTEADAGIHRGYIPVTLSRPAVVSTTLAFTADCLSASLLNEVKIAKSGLLTFAIGQRIKNIAFTVRADLQPEELEKVVQHLTSRLASVTVLDNRGDAVVTNDDDGSLSPIPANREPGFVEETLPTDSIDRLGVGDIEQVTVTPSGGEPSYVARDPGSGSYTSVPGGMALSHDGRYVAFSSAQVDLVNGDTNGVDDVFVRDLVAGTTERVSMHPDGSQITLANVMGGNPDYGPYPAVVISADGRFVAYTAWAAVGPGDVVSGAALPDIYVFDRVSRTTELVSQTTEGVWLHGATAPSISAQGRYITFVVGTDLYVRDRVAGTTTSVIHSAFGGGNPVLSANGRYVAAPIRLDSCYDQRLLVIDLANGATERVDLTDDGRGASQENVWAAYMYTPAISEDGRYVAFKASSWNLVPGITEDPEFPGSLDVTLMHAYVRDLQQLSTTMVGVQPDGSLPRPTPDGSRLAISADGRLVALSDDGRPGQLFDMTTGVATSIGMPYSYSSLNTRFGPASMSGDGRYLAFESTYTAVVDHIFLGDAFVQRLS